MWQGLSGPLSVVFAPEGDIVGFYLLGDMGSRIVIVDTITGRSVDLPRPERTQFGGLLAIRGGVPLPVPAVPATPAPTPLAATPVPSLIAGAPRLVTGSIEYDAVARSATVRVQLVGPAEGGGLAVIDELPPVVLPRVRRNEPWFQLRPRPGTSSVVVAVGNDDSGSLVVWTPSGGGIADGPASGGKAEALPLPVGSPDRPTGIVLRPDGKAIAMAPAEGRRSAGENKWANSPPRGLGPRPLGRARERRARVVGPCAHVPRLTCSSVLGG